MNNWIVYKHICPNSKCYIGITSKSITQRWANGLGYQGQRYFSNAIKKYGWENIKHEILFENLTKEEACQKEIELIAEYKSNDRNFGYNGTCGGDGTKGCVYNENQRKERSNRMMGNKYGLDKKRSEEQRKNLSDAMKGRVPWNKGISHSEETKQKISDAKKNPSEETRNKLREAARGKIATDICKEKMSLAKKGIPLTDDHKTKLSDARKRYLLKKKQMQLEVAIY